VLEVVEGRTLVVVDDAMLEVVGRWILVVVDDAMLEVVGRILVVDETTEVTQLG